jgi:uncharacterized protein with ATP-grasp and redox domains
MEGTTAPVVKPENTFVRDKEKQIILRTQDEVLFLLSESYYKQMITIAHLLEDLDESTDPIPVPNVYADTFRYVCKYAGFMHEAPVLTDVQIQEQRSTEITGFAAEIVRQSAPSNTEVLKHVFLIILAANFLDFKALLGLACKSVAHRVRNKTEGEILCMFNIDKISQEVIDAVENDNSWVKLEATA